MVTLPCICIRSEVTWDCKHALRAQLEVDFEKGSCFQKQLYMAYYRGQNSTFEFDVVVSNFYLDLQLNIQVSYFSTLLVDLTLFVSRFNFVVRSIQHSSELPLLAPTNSLCTIKIGYHITLVTIFNYNTHIMYTG